MIRGPVGVAGDVGCCAVLCPSDVNPAGINNHHVERLKPSLARLKKKLAKVIMKIYGTAPVPIVMYSHVTKPRDLGLPSLYQND